MPPKKQRGGRRRRRVRGNGFGRGSNFVQSDRIIREKFIYHARFQTSATVLTTFIDPLQSATLFGPELTTAASMYQEFRCVGIRIKQYPSQAEPTSTGSSETGHAIGWRPMISAVAPNSVDDVLASPVSSYTTDHLTVPVEFRLTRRDFASTNALKWYHQRSTISPDASLQGALYHVAVGTNAGTSIVTWIIQSEWEFRGFVQTGQYLRLPKPILASGLQPSPGSDVKVVEQPAPDRKLAPPAKPPSLVVKIPPRADENFRPASVHPVTGYVLVEEVNDASAS